jgi:hypothetical protein
MTQEASVEPWRTVQWWPSLAGIAFAVFVVWRMEDGADLAPILVASGLCYLGAAALNKPGAAWPLFLLTFIVVAPVSAGVAAFDPSWVLLAISAAFFVYGLIRGVTRPFSGLPLQAIALLALGAMALIAAVIDETVGALLVAAGLLAHAAWDVYHHRANKVVSRSLAEFCCVLDTALAAAILFVTLS